MKPSDVKVGTRWKSPYGGVYEVTSISDSICASVCVVAGADRRPGDQNPASVNWVSRYALPAEDEKKPRTSEVRVGMRFKGHESDAVYEVRGQISGMVGRWRAECVVAGRRVPVGDKPSFDRHYILEHLIEDAPAPEADLPKVGEVWRWGEGAEKHGVNGSNIGKPFRVEEVDTLIRYVYFYQGGGGRGVADPGEWRARRPERVSEANETATPPKPKLQHDFSDPYCAWRLSSGQVERLCKACGTWRQCLWYEERCTPVAGWRERFERDLRRAKSTGSPASPPLPDYVGPLTSTAGLACTPVSTPRGTR